MSLSGDTTTYGVSEQAFAVLGLDGKLVVATAFESGGSGTGISVVREGASAFAPIDNSTTPFIASARPDRGVVHGDSNWDLGLCASSGSVAVFYFDAANSKNVRGALYSYASGWSLGFFNADRDIDTGSGPGSYDPAANEEASLSAVFANPYCYLAWNQGTTVYLVRFEAK